MIRDIVILQNSGTTLFYQNFGECHSFGDNVDLISGFLSAIQVMSRKISGSDLTVIEFQEKKWYFHKNDERTYLVIAEQEDDEAEIKTKMGKIAEIFENTYQAELEAFSGETRQFDQFGQTLIDLSITQKNCGGRPECVGCPNSTKSLPLEDFIKFSESKGFFARLRSIFKKD